MAKIRTFHVDAKGSYIHSSKNLFVNSIWLNRVEGRRNVGRGENHGQDNNVPCGRNGLLHTFK